jgi:hypothetical protein
MSRASLLSGTPCLTCLCLLLQSEHTRVNEDMRASALEDVYSDGGFEEEDEADEDIHRPPQVAALRIQARQRGRQARRELEHQNTAARTVQARQRGRQARREVAEQRDAATQIQAMHRGKASRRQYEQKVREETAATRIQAQRRGTEGRRAAEAARQAQGLDVPSDVSSEEEDAAAQEVLAARVAAAEAGIAVAGTPDGVLGAVKVRSQRLDCSLVRGTRGGGLTTDFSCNRLC